MRMRALAAGCGLGLLAGTGPIARAGEPVSLLPPPGLQALETSYQLPVAPAVTEAPRQASVYKAALLSALLPGLGESYAGHTRRALLSGGAEAAIWISYATFKTQEDLRGDRSLEYAVAYARARADGDDDYYKAVGQFTRADGPGMWNEYVRRKERDTGEIVGREYTGDEAWAWTSDARFFEYRELRHDMLTAGDHASNALALLLVNRVVSIVSVVQAVHADHGRTPQGFGLRFEPGGSPLAPRARVGLWNRF